MSGLTLTPDERIAALERRIADAEFTADVERIKRESLENQVQELQQREITVADLPVAALCRKLEMVWLPRACDLLEPGSITAELFAEGARA